MKTPIYNILMLFGFVLLTACGGGTSTPTPIPNPTEWIGTKLLGEVGVETQGTSVTTDTNGNVYVAGYTTGNLDGNSRVGIRDFFVTKYDDTGVKQYTRQLGVAGAQTLGASVATDASGNVFVAGTTYGGLDENTLTGTRDLFVTKYNGAGTKQFTRQLGVAGFFTEGQSITSDTSGNVYVAGSTNGSLDGISPAGNSYFFVSKYDGTGTKQFTKQLGVAGFSTNGYSVAIDTTGNIYVAGTTYGSLDGISLAGNSYFFVTKYDVTGTEQFTKQLGVAGVLTRGYSVATDASGNVYVAGHTNGALDDNNKIGASDFFVTKYDGAGNKEFTKQLGVAGFSTEGHSVTTDASGNIYVAGHTNGNLDGNTRVVTSDFFVTKYDSTGDWQYTRQLGVLGFPTLGRSVITDASGNVFVAGQTSGNLDGNTLSGTIDFFVTKYDSSGVKQ